MFGSFIGFFLAIVVVVVVVLNLLLYYHFAIVVAAALYITHCSSACCTVRLPQINVHLAVSVQHPHSLVTLWYITLLPFNPVPAGYPCVSLVLLTTNPATCCLACWYLALTIESLQVRHTMHAHDWHVVAILAHVNGVQHLPRANPDALLHDTHVLVLGNL